jgi:hypothetical protein
LSDRKDTNSYFKKTGGKHQPIDVGTGGQSPIVFDVGPITGNNSRKVESDGEEDVDLKADKLRETQYLKDQLKPQSPKEESEDVSGTLEDNRTSIKI